MKKLGFSFLFLILSALPLRADMLDAGIFYATERYAEAFGEYLLEANAGNPEAFYWVGLMYYDGTGTEQNYTAAIDWFIRAATEHGENGDPAAMKILGDIHYIGQGIEKNTAAALQYYQQAADLGHAEAGYITGNLYAQGTTEIKPNLTYALIYWEIAAKNDHVPSMHNAAYIYEQGFTGKQDHDKAYALYLKAAEKNYAPAQTKVGLYAKNYQPKQNYPLAIKWLTAAAQKQQTIAQHELGMMYFEGLGVDKDIAKMIQYFEKAAANNYPRAARDLGDIYNSDDYGFKNPGRAIEYYELGAKLGDPAAQRSAALMHFNGNGTNKDVVRAAAWLIVAAEADPKNQADRDTVLTSLSPTEKQKAETMAASKGF